jgi:hypothetical protein
LINRILEEKLVIRILEEKLVIRILEAKLVIRILEDIKTVKGKEKSNGLTCSLEQLTTDHKGNPGSGS